MPASTFSALGLKLAEEIRHSLVAPSAHVWESGSFKPKACLWMVERTAHGNKPLVGDEPLDSAGRFVVDLGPSEMNLSIFKGKPRAFRFQHFRGVHEIRIHLGLMCC